MKQMLLEKIGPCTERQYTDRQGQQQVFAERVMRLSDGLNTMHAFLTGDRARQTPVVREGDIVSVQLSSVAREWDTQQGEKRYETTIYVDRISTLWRR